MAFGAALLAQAVYLLLAVAWMPRPWLQRVGFAITGAVFLAVATYHRGADARRSRLAALALSALFFAFCLFGATVMGLGG